MRAWYCRLFDIVHVTALQDLVAGDARMHYVECGQEFIKEQMLGMGLDPVRSLFPGSMHARDEALHPPWPT